MKIHRSAPAIAAFILIQAYCISAQVVGFETPVKGEMEGNIIVVKLADGDSLFPKIAQIARRFGVAQGVVLFDIGQLRDFTVGQYNPVSKRFVSRTFLTPWELVSLQGTIAIGADGKGGMIANCQATLADSSGCTVGGHLSRGIVSLVNEIVILKLSEIGLFRSYNAKYGFWELDIIPQ